MTRRVPAAAFALTGLAVAVLLAFLVAPHASSSPDGLERVAADQRLDTDARASAVAGGPLADYSADGVEDDGLSTGIAGVIGVTVTFGASLGLITLVSIRRSRASAQPPARV